MKKQGANRSNFNLSFSLFFRGFFISFPTYRLSFARMKKALILWGGWTGHEPEEMAALFSSELKKEGFDVEVENSLVPLEKAEHLQSYDLIFPCWTMGSVSEKEVSALSEAIASGVGLGGFHGGMGDAFRGAIDYEWMVGGLFVGHPYIGDYEVSLTGCQSPITEGMPETFSYHSEQYYMLVDPGNDVLAETVYHHDGRRAIMPVVWTKTWGKGRVFYSALGHKAREFSDYPEVKAMTLRGLKWAARLL